MEARQAGSSAKRGGQPRPDRRAQQPLIQKSVGRKRRQPTLHEIKLAEPDQRAKEDGIGAKPQIFRDMGTHLSKRRIADQLLLNAHTFFGFP